MLAAGRILDKTSKPPFHFETRSLYLPARHTNSIRVKFLSGRRPRLIDELPFSSRLERARPRSVRCPFGQFVQRRARGAKDSPLAHRHRAELLIKPDRLFIPVKHGPLQTTAAPFLRHARKVSEEHT